MNEPINTLGFKEMHPMQVEALVDLINRAINPDYYTNLTLPTYSL